MLFFCRFRMYLGGGIASVFISQNNVASVFVSKDQPFCILIMK